MADEFFVKLPDGDRPVLHQSRTGLADRRGRVRGVHSKRSPSASVKRRWERCCRAGCSVTWNAASPRSPGGGTRRGVGGPEEGRGTRTKTRCCGPPARSSSTTTDRVPNEAFGNESLFVVVRDEAELLAVLDELEGNLTGAVVLGQRWFGRRAVRPGRPPVARESGTTAQRQNAYGGCGFSAMNHGGPFPATGHPVFTAVGIPASIRRFTRLESYDAVRPRAASSGAARHEPTGKLWREIDGVWTCADVVPA